MRNIEIKAKIKQLNALIKTAASLSDSEVSIMRQHDTFFASNNGRLKLRKFENGSGELIQYTRPDIEGPKLSSFERAPIAAENVDALHTVLERALGATGSVKKVRRLFMVGQTRIHVDSVKDLGDFLELEVVLKPEQTPEEGESVALKLMQELGVDKGDLISGAYMDLLTK